MSVFTAVPDADIRALLAEYGLEASSISAADAGIENSNYLIRAHRSGQPEDVVLTLFEQLPPARIDHCLDLLERLAHQGLPVPRALPHPRGRRFTLAHKPAVLVPWLPGEHPQQPTAQQCREIGSALGRFHQITAGVVAEASEREELGRLLSTLPQIAERPLLQRLANTWMSQPLLCVVHGDLFRDNALFEGDRLSGILDIYQAARDHPAWDVAVAMNDWCLSADTPDPLLEQALWDGYREQARQWAEQVEPLLPLACVVAALRFWLSRRQQQSQVAVAGLGHKNPAPLWRLLQHRLARYAP